MGFWFKMFACVIAICMFFNMDYVDKLLWLQYAPIVVTFACAIFSAVFDEEAFDRNSKSAGYSLINQVSSESKNKVLKYIYYTWEIIVIVIQVVVIILLTINEKGGFFDKLAAFVCSSLLGIGSYAVLTGQAFLTAGGKGNERTKRKSAFNATAGMKYVPGVGLYRDEEGNYYNSLGIAVPAPVSIENKNKKR